MRAEAARHARDVIPDACRACGGEDLVPLVYGMPICAMWEARGLGRAGARARHPAAGHTTSLESWGRFRAVLIATLRAMPPETFLIISGKTEPHDVQFARAPAGRLRAETVANAFLDRAQQVEGATLGYLGWEAPGARDVNHWRAWDTRVPWEEVATLALRTLGETHGFVSPGELQYRAFARGGASIWYPQLGLDEE